MRKAISILFTLIVLLQAGYQGIVYAYYVVNKAYIAETLCENKEIPEVRCDGKCHLRKMIDIKEKVQQQDNAPEQAPVPNLSEIKTPLLFLEVINATPPLEIAFSLPVEDKILAYWYNFHYQYHPTTEIFNPPRQLV